MSQSDCSLGTRSPYSVVLVLKALTVKVETQTNRQKTTLGQGEGYVLG